MRPIQMVDLKQQYQKIKPEVDAAVLSVLENSAFINGPQVQRFASSLAFYNGVGHVVPCANGTDALQIAMMALDLKEGDEVITPSFTYIATTEVIALLKLKPVFVDVDPKTFCLNPEAVDKAISAKTRAIVPVHLFGQSADMERILAIAAAHHLYVIEDNAQAIGCDYYFSDGRVQKTGAMGTVSGTSFFPSKNLGCYGDGGAMMTNDSELASKLKMIANHGQSRRYHHDLVGCNSRLDTLQATVLEIKLKYLDQYTTARRSVADYYDAAFSGQSCLTTPFRASYTNHVFHQYTLLLAPEKRDGLKDYLQQKGIPSMIYYPVPAHRQKMFGASATGEKDLEVTDWLAERVISLPIHTEMDEEQLQFITTNVLQYLN
ncbi:MAG TPA: DegT/DnrJ/EryC1/StrS family aminotransferase [Chitinophagaceae bacterium]